MGEQRPIRVFFVPLGCAKNLVDSERMLHTLRQNGMEIVGEPDGADAAVVNTCGFIQSAQEEAIGILLRLAEFKKHGRLRALIAAGCLPQRFQKEFLDELPEVDAAVAQIDGPEFQLVLPQVGDGLDAQPRPRFIIEP